MAQLTDIQGIMKEVQDLSPMKRQRIIGRYNIQRSRRGLSKLVYRPSHREIRTRASLDDQNAIKPENIQKLEDARARTQQTEQRTTLIKLDAELKAQGVQDIERRNIVSDAQKKEVVVRDGAFYIKEGRSFERIAQTQDTLARKARIKKGEATTRDIIGGTKGAREITQTTSTRAVENYNNKQSRPLPMSSEKRKVLNNLPMNANGGFSAIDSQTKADIASDNFKLANPVNKPSIQPANINTWQKVEGFFMRNLDPTIQPNQLIRTGAGVSFTIMSTVSPIIDVAKDTGSLAYDSFNMERGFKLKETKNVLKFYEDPSKRKTAVDYSTGQTAEEQVAFFLPLGFEAVIGMRGLSAQVKGAKYFANADRAIVDTTYKFSKPITQTIPEYMMPGRKLTNVDDVIGATSPNAGKLKSITYKTRPGLPVIDLSLNKITQRQLQLYPKTVEQTTVVRIGDSTLDIRATKRPYDTIVDAPMFQPLKPEINTFRNELSRLQQSRLFVDSATTKPSVLLKNNPKTKNGWQYEIKDFENPYIEDLNLPGAYDLSARSTFGAEAEAQAILVAQPQRSIFSLNSLGKRGSLGGRSSQSTESVLAQRTDNSLTSYKQIKPEFEPLKVQTATTLSNGKWFAEKTRTAPPFIVVPTRFNTREPLQQTSSSEPQTSKYILNEELATDRLSDFKINTKRKVAVKTNLKIQSGTKSVFEEAYAPVLIEKSKTNFKEKQVQEQVQKQVQKQQSRSRFSFAAPRYARPTYNPPNIRDIETIKAKIPKPPPKLEWESKAREKLGFKVITRVGGKEKILPGVYSRKDVVRYGAYVTKTTARASFRTVASSSSVTRVFNKAVSMADFVKNKKGWFVEKKEKRINTPGELNEITFKGLGKRRIPLGMTK
jgi:hypothetical protein